MDHDGNILVTSEEEVRVVRASTIVTTITTTASGSTNLNPAPALLLGSLPYTILASSTRLCLCVQCLVVA